MVGVGYDATTGRPSTVTFDRGTLGYGYSPTTGQLTSLTAPGGASLAFTYDGMLPKTATWSGPVAGSVGVGYNSDFRVTSQTVNGANSIAFGYDRDGLLTAAGTLGLKRAAQTGLLERDSVGTVLSVWGYDPRGALASYSASAGGAALFQSSYVRDSLSRITELTETVQGVASTIAFTYDSAGRLETVRRGGTLTASYRYDANGNRLDVTTPGGVVSGVYDTQDRLTSYGTATYTYTANGERREQVVGIDTTRYTYDALGNLTRVQPPGGTDIEYLIDPQNRRIGKKVDGVLVQGLALSEPVGAGGRVGWVRAGREPVRLRHAAERARVPSEGWGHLSAAAGSPRQCAAGGEQRPTGPWRSGWTMMSLGGSLRIRAPGSSHSGMPGGCLRIRQGWCDSGPGTTTRRSAGGRRRISSASAAGTPTSMYTSATIQSPMSTPMAELSCLRFLRHGLYMSWAVVHTTSTMP